MKIHTIHCLRSGIPLAQVRPLCVEGNPMVKNLAMCMVHPMYSRDLHSLLYRLSANIKHAEELSWQCSEKEEQAIALHISAILYNLGALQDDYACLPTWKVCIGSAPRLLTLANWYHFATSKRLHLPRYRPHVDNANVGWGNLSAWLDACYEIKTAWEQGRANIEKDELLKSRESALHTVKTEAAYKRVDLTKVWNWIDIQISEKYPEGRRTTWRSLWLSGDIEQENWCQDDVEDLQLAVLECCDMGNEITHYISTRLKHIREMIRDFYSSFTILSSVKGDSLSAHPDLTPQEREKEAAFFAEIDKAANAIDEIPAEPQRNEFATMGLFLKAQAQHRLLVRRFELRKNNTPASNAA